MSKGVKWDKVDVNGDFKYLNLDGRTPATMSLENDMGNAKFWTSQPIQEETQRMSQKKTDN